MRRGRSVFRAALAFFLIALGGCRSAPIPAPSITLALLGDVMLGRGVHPSAQSFSYLAPYLSSADLALANLESPLTVAPIVSTSPYILCAAPSGVDSLADSGLDLLSLANNHRDDCGEAGQSETRRVLENAGLGYIGPGSQPVYREIKGVRLAFLAFDATSGWDAELAREAVRSSRSTGAIVVVSMHWGSEYQSGPSSQQAEIAAQLAEAGAALIWGHHPHVLQPAAWIGSTLVLYSLGNALFDQYGLTSTRQSALLLVTLDPSGIQKLEVVAFAIDVPHSRIVQASPEEAPGILKFFDIRKGEN